MFSSRIMNIIAGFYRWLVSFFSHFQSLFLLFIRIIWGHQFFLIGLKKVTNPGQTELLFQKVGVPMSLFHVYFVGYIELIGGICLLIGLASRLFSIPLSIIMIGAYSTAHSYVFQNWGLFSNPQAIMQEPPFTFLMICVIILCFGPGRFSIDGWIKRWSNNRRY